MSDGFGTDFVFSGLIFGGFSANVGPFFDIGKKVKKTLPPCQWLLIKFMEVITAHQIGMFVSPSSGLEP